MARVKHTTVTTASKDISIPYSFKCNYCGHLCAGQKIETVYGSFAKSGLYDDGFREGFERGAESELEKNIEDHIIHRAWAVESYAARLRCNEPLNPVVWGHPAGGLFMDGHCPACGRYQVWDTESLLRDMPPMPSIERSKSKATANTVFKLAGIIGTIGMIAIIGLTSFPPKTGLIIAGVILITCIVGALATSSPDEGALREAYKKKYLTEKLASEPNDPDNLPALGVKLY